jgi:biopolymer transport protein ExbD
MKFRNHSPIEPEINLIPFIDVLLVIVIFLMISTTFSKLTQVDLNLPQSSTGAVNQPNNPLILIINAQGQVSLNQINLGKPDATQLASALAKASEALQKPMVVIAADARTPHQQVLQALEAAQKSGIEKITFQAQARPGK